MSTEVSTTFAADPVSVFKNPDEYAKFFTAMKADIDKFVPDLSTKKGRDEIASLAYKVTRTKTAIDTAGKELNEDAQSAIAAVNKKRVEIKSELETLATAIRAPLTKWEQDEKERADKSREIQNDIHDLSIVREGEGSNLISDRIGRIDEIEVSFDIFGDDLGQVQTTKAQIRASLELALSRAKQHEADQAELSALRAAAKMREDEDARKAAEEAQAKAQAEADEVERIRAHQAQADRIQHEANIAEAARIDAEQKAAAARELELRKIAEAEIARVQAEKDALEKLIANRAAAEEAERAALAERQAMRQIGAAQRVDVQDRTVSALEFIGLSKPKAITLFQFILDGKIPTLKVVF